MPSTEIHAMAEKVNRDEEEFKGQSARFNGPVGVRIVNAQRLTGHITRVLEMSTTLCCVSVDILQERKVESVISV